MSGGDVLTTPHAEPEAEELVRACRKLAGQGLSPGGSGNVSVRLDEQLLITPTGSSLARVVAGEIAVVDLRDGTVREGRPSKELPLHRAVYQARHDAQAVVHLHSPYAVAASCLTEPLPPLTPYQVMRLGELPVAPYARPGSTELADGVARLAVEHPLLLLANHGPLVSARTLHGSVDLAEELETGAQVSFLLSSRSYRSLLPEQVDQLREPPG